MRLSRHTAPTTEPMHLTEAKLHLRLAVDAAGAVLYTSEDSVLSSMISACRQVAETETWVSLVLQTWDLFLEEWPECNVISLPLCPLRTVEFIEYTDSSGETFEFTDFTIDTASTPGRIVLNYSESWPSVTLSPNNPIQIRFKCGGLVPCSADSVTDKITAIGGLFADDDKIRLSVSGGELPGGLSVLTDYFVVGTVGNSFGLSLEVEGDAVDITSAGSGLLFIGEISPAIMTGMKLVLTDIHSNRGDTTLGKPSVLPRAASNFFAMDAVKTL
jgi:uncharacterized phiE125 gp8 family phage protein